MYAPYNAVTGKETWQLKRATAQGWQNVMTFTDYETAHKAFTWYVAQVGNQAIFILVRGE